MKAYISAFGVFLLTAQAALAQAPTTSKNYVVETTVKTPGKTTPAQLMGLSAWEAAKSIQYLDGLGRRQQSVHWQASPGQKDIVQPIVYDAYGRETKKYLPYAEQAGNDGSFKGTALSSQASFYGVGAGWDANVAKTAYPFSETVFEASPLNRVLQQGAPGLPWQPSASRTTTGRTMVLDYGTNTSIDAVKQWNVENPSGATSTQSYGAGKLYKSITRDENWTSGKIGTVEEFKDLEGRVILKRAWETESLALNTYYIYDALGNLRYVLPPAVTVSSFAIADEVFTKFIYGYNYDGRNRIIEKHIPGKGWEHLVYNRLDQLVMSQDAKMRNELKWAFTKYDVHGRPVISGIMAKDTLRLDLQNRFDSPTLNPVLWESRNDANALTTNTGYTRSVYPSITLADCMVINYYDDYAFYGNTAATPSGTSTKLKGLATASKVRVIDAATMLLKAMYYDDEGRVIQTIADSHLGADTVKNAYSFAGELLNTVRVHAKGSEVTTIANVYIYDHMGRKRHSKQNINNKGGVWLNRLDYNEIGQLRQKSLHSTNEGTSFLQSTNYTYNERGWLKASESPQFNMKLGYQDAANPQYNGNIASQQWGASYANQFLYTYDRLNRLTKGISTGVVMSEIIGYDAMGNIDSLNRDGVQGVYTYNGNKLTSIAGGTMATGIYEYNDLNGNATKDGRTGVTLSYNHLNLPKTVTRSSPSLGMAYTYDASGEKLKMVITKAGTTTYDYIDGIQYTNGAIDFIQTEEGVARNSGGTYSYEYNLTDHLGNVRYSFKNPTTGPITPLQADDYYAFGLRKIATPGINKYLYNGKELQDDLEQYDYGARFYDPVVGRFNTVDPLSEVSRRSSVYGYALNNPIRFIDVDGMYADEPTPKEAALIAAHVYGNVKDKIVLTGGWIVSNRDVGLKGSDFTNSNTGIKSALYERTVDGKTEYVYATAGTEVPNIKNTQDIGANAAQVFGTSAQYEKSVDNAKAIKASLGSSELTYVGHSLGGGEASVNAIATGDKAITFNASGISIPTKIKYGGWMAGFSSFSNKITAYQLKSDPLTILQDATILPGALGTVKMINPNGSAAMKNGHSILNVIKSIR